MAVAVEALNTLVPSRFEKGASACANHSQEPPAPYACSLMKSHGSHRALGSVRRMSWALAGVAVTEVSLPALALMEVAVVSAPSMRDGQADVIVLRHVALTEFVLTKVSVSALGLAKVVVLQRAPAAADALAEVLLFGLVPMEEVVVVPVPRVRGGGSTDVPLVEYSTAAVSELDCEALSATNAACAWRTQVYSISQA